MKNITPSIIILLSLLGFNFLIRPAYDRTPALQAEIEQYNSAIEKAKELDGLVADVAQKYNSIPGENLARLDKITPSNPNNMHLAADINALALRFGTSIKGFQMGNEVSSSDSSSSSSSGETTIGFSFSSSYPSFIQFMKEIENSLRVMDVRSITFTANEKGTFDYRVSLVAYSVQ